MASSTLAASSFTILHRLSNKNLYSRSVWRIYTFFWLYWWSNFL